MSDDMMRDGAMDEPMNDGPTDGRASLPAECAAFDAALADYLEGALAPAQRAALESHRAICSRCDALVEDLEGIVTAARSLPAIVPSGAATEAMWSAVSSRIGTPTLAIDSAAGRRRVGSAGARARFDGWRRQLVAAAALVLVTAGVTYSVTHRVEQERRGERVAVANERPTSTTIVPTPIDSSPSPTDVLADGGAAGSGTTTIVSNANGTKRRLAARPSATDTYEREIAQLRRVLTERRGELDSTTVAVVEGNLAVIDMAIKQSREALKRDPRSRFLGDQLNSALDKKLELLRTAALLPART